MIHARSEPPLVSVIVVNFNAGTYLSRCLAGLADQTMTDFELILVDNGSTDGSLEAALAEIVLPRLTVDRAGCNLGFAAANNRAATRAAGRWLALLNPDAFPDPQWLARLTETAERRPGVALFGSTQIDAVEPGRYDGLGDNYFITGLPWRGGLDRPSHQAARDGEVFAPCSAAAFYRADVFRSLGGFDERFFCYVEDIDLGFRFRLAGFRAIQAAGAVVRHVGGASAARRSGFARYHGTRNLIWTFVKNMPGPLFWTVLPAHAITVCALVLWAATRGEGAAAARGVRDAVLGLPAIWADRRRLQAARCVSWLEIARALTWSPILFASRGLKVVAERPTRGR